MSRDKTNHQTSWDNFGLRMSNMVHRLHKCSVMVLCVILLSNMVNTLNKELYNWVKHTLVSWFMYLIWCISVVTSVRAMVIGGTFLSHFFNSKDMFPARVILYALWHKKTENILLEFWPGQEGPANTWLYNFHMFGPTEQVSEWPRLIRLLG